MSSWAPAGLMALIVVGAPGTAFAQSQSGESVTVRGDCDGLVVFGTDWSDACVDSLMNVVHNNGVLSLVFSASDRALVTFIGHGRNQTTRGQQATLQIDGITVTPMRPGARAAEFQATGSCSFGNPYGGAMRVHCEATTAEGRFLGTFITDGTRPTTQRF